MRISAEGIRLIKDYEALRLYAYPDPESDLARATRGQRWGFVPAATIMEMLPPEQRVLSGSPWTIGYGTTFISGMPVTMNDQCSIGQAEVWLENDIWATEQSLNDAIFVPLAQGMYDALVSWAYNVGIGAMKKSTLIRLLNEGDYIGAQAEFDRWVKSNGKSSSGLMMRRNREQKMFNDAIREALKGDPDALADFDRQVEERDL